MESSGLDDLSYRRNGGVNMKLTYFLLWLVGGGLVALEAYACFGLLQFSQVQEDAEDERLWEMLVRPGRS